MSRRSQQKPHEMGPYKMQEFPATELSAAVGLYPSDRDSFDYAQTLALKERLADICKRCAIRFGLPDQARRHLGDAIGLPNEPLLRYPHREIPLDPRWKALANALRFPPTGDFPLVNLEVTSSQHLQSLKDALPSLLEDIDLEPRYRHDTSRRPRFRPISRELGDSLVDKMEKVQSFGESDNTVEGYNRALARNTYRQMRIYIALGPEWTLVEPLENLILVSHTLPKLSS